MLNFFKKKENTSSLVLNNDVVNVNWTEEEKILLKSIWQQTSLSREEFDLTYTKFLTNAINYLSCEPEQGWPETQYGNVRNSILIIVNTALRIRQGQIIPRNLKSEDAAYLSEIMSFVVVVCIVLEQIGSVAGSIEVSFSGNKVWCPYLHPLPANSKIIGRRVAPQNYALLFLPKLVNQEGQEWLSEKPEAFVELLNYFSLRNNTEISNIVDLAKRTFLSNGSNQIKSDSENVSYQNSTETIEVAEEEESTESSDVINIVKPVVKNTKDKNKEAKEPVGWKFIYWVRKKIKDGVISISDETSFVQILDDGGLFLVIPDAFEAYEDECEIPVNKAKNQVTRLNLHIVKENGNNIFITKTKLGAKRRGLIFKDKALFFDKNLVSEGDGLLIRGILK